MNRQKEINKKKVNEKISQKAPSLREKTTTKDMTSGSIIPLLVGFSVPLILGNLFQMMYNTVDSLVVGNFVGNEALAAVGATTQIINILVFFFNGLSIGATVVIGRYFGALNDKKLHEAVETTIFITFVMSVLLTLLGIAMVRPMLLLMSTPDNVINEASTYLNIYFAGLSGLLIYNMGSGILRAVGDTLRPLILLILTSVANVFLDLLFVIAFGLGIAGVAYATIISQAVSAVLVLIMLSVTKDVHKLIWRDLKCNIPIFKDIFIIGIPAATQACITAISNTFVQSYINYFGSNVMAGWTAYNKLDTFLMLPMQSFAQSATTFTSQNIGAGKIDRVNEGTYKVLELAVGVTAFTAIMVFIFARFGISAFSPDEEVIESGVLFIRTNVLFIIFNSISHTLSGCLRGRGDSTGPMVVMLLNFVLVRQIYLFIVTRFIINTPRTVGFGYPVGWAMCCFTMLLYQHFRYAKGTVYKKES